MERDAIDLGELKVSTLFKKLFIPTLLGMLSMSFVAVADGIFVGHGVGSEGIAAVNISIPLYMIFTGLGLMVGVGSSVVASIHLSQNKVKAARLNVTQAFLFISIIALIPSLLMMVFSTGTARLLGSSEHLLPLVTDYLLWGIPGFFFQMWIAVGLFVVRLDGAPKLAMWCSVISALVNFVLDWVFIFPLGWGVKGAAIASTISLVIGGGIAVIYLWKFANTLRFYKLKISRKSIHLSIRNVGYQCRIGSSSLLSEATMAVLLFTGNQVFMSYLGDAGVGAFGIASYYLPFVFMIGNAIAQSAQPIISYNYGAGNHSRVSKAGHIAISTAVLCALVVMSAFVFIPEILIGFFISEQDPASQIAIDGFPYISAGFICFIINLSSIGYYQSLEMVKPAMAFAVLRGFIFLVPAFLLLPISMGTVGIWLAMPLSELITMVIVLSFYVRNRRKRMLSIA